MIFPAFEEGLDDPEIRGAPKELYAALRKRLDFLQFRPLKIWPIAQELKMNKSVAGRAMKRLVEHGYIDEGPRTKPGGRSYRLFWSRKR